MDKKNNFVKNVSKHWVWILIGFIFVVQVIIMYGFGEHIYASTHDNLELHILDYHLLSKNNLFFTHNTMLPILNGISRDYFFSEFSLYSFLYMLLPTCYAYITSYFLKIIIGFLSCILLARYILKDKYKEYEKLVVILSFAFANLPLYPAFTFGFVSIPLLIFILLNLYEKRGVGWYILLFLYPLLSYFTFFGVFILGYLFLVIIYKIIQKHKIPRTLIIAFFVLFLGYAVMEYRLFYVMLFSNIETIRTSMVMDDWNILQVLKQTGLTYINGIFHAESCHTYFIMPLCIIGFFIINIKYLQKKEYKKLKKDPFNFIMIFILFNCFIYGIYGFKPFRDVIEACIPIIKGLQLNRTIFFNPFLWYVAFFLLLIKLFYSRWKKITYYLAVISLFIVMIMPVKYNDFFHTCFNHFYELVKAKESNNLDFQEYYSAELMEQIKKDINYQGEKSVAFGINPAVLEYSNIYTLDGCISYYSLAYKQQFRALIAPALEQNEDNRIYFDGWGARAYIYSASNEPIYDAVRDYQISDCNLYMDTDIFKKMDGTYIFSRIEIANTEEKNIELVNVYSHEKSPYIIYLYKME